MTVRRICLGLAVAATLVIPAIAADVTADPALKKWQPATLAPETVVAQRVYRGRVAVMDGRTLWFPEFAAKVRLLDIDACELPQWAFDPKWNDRDRIKAPPPVPCGPLAKAWLKRTTGNAIVLCTVAAYDRDGSPLARCTVKGTDLGLELLRVGWARVATPYPADPSYLSRQRHAMAARYGMWATYMLDMDEWRRKAVDRTLARQPIADFNLLSERESEISPPFVDARRKRKRTDR
jgi:endonuclease YncB( thermonuclease family)